MPATRRLVKTIIIFLLVGAFGQLITLPVSSAARLVDTDSHVYSHLQRRALVSGSGLQGYETYYLWLRKPGEKNSSYTGNFFAATTVGGVPYPDVGVSFDAPPVLGTYSLTISTSSEVDTSESKCNFGVIGTARSVYQRREVAKIVGGGAFPGSTIRIDVRNPLDTLVRNATVVANQWGEFEHTWSIPNNVPVGSWTFAVGGTGTFDNSLERYRTEGQFGITEASLSLSIRQQPLNKYQRTQTAKAVFIIKYPDGSPVTTTRPGSRPTDIYHTGIRVRSLPFTLTDTMNGIWVTEYAIPQNETLGKNVTFYVAANSFDDGFGNKAPSSSFVSSQFEVTPAQLSINVSDIRTEYQLMFDSLTLNATVKYPDGMNLVSGKAFVTFETGNWKDQRPLTLSAKSRTWTTTYYFDISEIQRLGTWKIVISAEDGYGNKGEMPLEVRVGILWLAVTVATLTILSGVIVKWMREEDGFRRLLKKKGPKDPAPTNLQKMF